MTLVDFVPLAGMPARDTVTGKRKVTLPVESRVPLPCADENENASPGNRADVDGVARTHTVTPSPAAPLQLMLTVVP